MHRKCERQFTAIKFLRDKAGVCDENLRRTAEHCWLALFALRSPSMRDLCQCWTITVSSQLYRTMPASAVLSISMWMT